MKKIGIFLGMDYMKKASEQELWYENIRYRFYPGLQITFDKKTVNIRFVYKESNYFAKGLFPPCAFKLAVERIKIFSTSSNDIRNAFLCGLHSFSSASRTNRSALAPVKTGMLLISNAIIFHFKRLIMSQNYTYSSKPPRKSQEICKLSTNYHKTSTSIILCTFSKAVLSRKTWRGL